MSYFKGLSIFLVVLFLFSTVSGAFAAEKTSDDMNDFDHYTGASKIAYLEAWYKYRNEVGVIPDEMHTLKGVKEYFASEGHHAKVAVVNTTITNLKPGDIVHVKNSAYAFLVYRGLNNDGDVVLESLYNGYVCSLDDFYEVFDGTAVKFIYNAADQTIADKSSIDGGNINDTAIYDSTLPAPTYSGESQYVKFWKRYQFDPVSTRNSPVKELAERLIKGKTTDLEKVEAIFSWVQDNIMYVDDNVGSTRYSIDILTEKKANSCEQARLVYALASFVGLTPIFHKADCKFPAGQFEHVWTDIKVNGNWMSADTTSQQNKVGNTTYSAIVNDYGRYDTLDC